MDPSHRADAPPRIVSIRRPIAVACAASAALVLVLAWSLPATSFVSGDSGVKWIAVRHAVARPAAPLDLPLPSIAGVDFPFVEPFFSIHGNHLHAVTSQAFVALTAPMAAMFGARGLFILPGLGFVLAIGSWLAVGLALDRTRSPGCLAASAVLGTPWLFYGLEFWEHAPALGLGGLAAALLLLSTHGPPRAGRTSLVVWAGILGGVATLLRPEAALFIGSVTIGALVSRSLAVRVVDAGRFALTAALVASADAVYGAIHEGTLLPTHVGANAGLLATDYLATRWALISEWLIWPGAGSASSVAPACLLAVFGAFGYRRDHRGARFLAGVLLVYASTVLLLAPNSGGGHWGARYLLFAYGPLCILTSDVLEAMSSRRLVGLSLVTVMLLGSAWIQRASYRRLRGVKLTYSRMAQFIGDAAAESAAVVTDLWWLDQIAPESAMRMPFLHVTTADDVASVFTRLHAANVEAVTIVKSGSAPPSALSDGSHGCFAEAGRTRHAERALIAIRLQRGRCG